MHCLVYLTVIVVDYIVFLDTSHTTGSLAVFLAAITVIIATAAVISHGSAFVSIEAIVP